MHWYAISLLKELISKLPDRERDCLTYRYGLNNAEPQTLEEFADKYGHTREWARQIEKKAIALIQRMPGYADICELTGNPIPPGAMHISKKQKHDEVADRDNGVTKEAPLRISECGAKSGYIVV